MHYSVAKTPPTNPSTTKKKKNSTKSFNERGIVSYFRPYNNTPPYVLCNEQGKFLFIALTPEPMNSTQKALININNV
jgi:hypothetical protein